MMFEKLSTDNGEDGLSEVGTGRYIALIKHTLGSSTILFSSQVNCYDKSIEIQKGSTKHYVELKIA